MATTLFQNFTQIPTRVPRWLWHVGRVISVSAMIGIVVLLLTAPDDGLLLLWGVAVPLLPLVWMFAPGFWRNLCPLSASNQTPRLFGFTRGKTLTPAVATWAYVIGITLFLTLASLRQVVFNFDATASALLLIGLMTFAFAGGFLFKGKSGWCSTFCPLLPVQRLYGQTPSVIVPNSYCKPCVGCAKNCYDFNPTAAQLADLHDSDPRYQGFRKFFAAVFPGFVFGFFHLDEAAPIAERLATIAIAVAVSVAVFTTLRTFVRLSPFRLTAVFGAAAWTLFYWWALPMLAHTLPELVGIDVAPNEVVVIALRAAVVALAAVWLWRTFSREPRFLARATAPAAAKVRSTGAFAKHIAKATSAPEVTFEPGTKHVAARMDQPVLEVAEAANLKIESGCRMGVCGADPVDVQQGMEHLCPVGDDERATLERLGFATSTRMACMARVRGPVTISLKPRRGRESWADGGMRRGFDPAVKKLVIIGNGIAGVTAADFARRHHKECEIHLLAKESVHLYNRMALSRVIYGRSALHGLYLLPETWYEEQNIQTWLNTRAVKVDRAHKEVVLATGERLGYDRLILAMGADALVPPTPGLDLQGTFALRTASDATAIRSYVQEHECRQVVVVGGGLLGLETAYALHKIGTSVTVLERGPNLMGRQLDARGGAVLERYLGGLGIQVMTSVALTRAAPDGRGRVVSVDLEDGRILPCDLLSVCIGIKPNIRLAVDAELETSPRGVKVDRFLRTSDPSILAAGDVAELEGQVGGLWPVGVEQAKLAAANAVCLPEKHKAFEPVVPVTLLKVSGIDVLSLGTISAEGDDETIICDETDPRSYRKLVVRNGTLIGAIVIGHPQLAPSVTSAVKKQRSITPIRAALARGDWAGLA